MNEESIFAAALEKKTPQERAAFLEGACAADRELRAKVDSLLEAHDDAGDFLESPAIEAPMTATMDTKPQPEQTGVEIGPYKLLQQIGEGGMGVVYMAEQTEPVSRRVALKVIKPGMDSRQVIARFEAERQALALMDHPNIAKVLDAATTESGRPYFVMELVRGVPITEYCDQQHLTTRERLELFIPVCQGVQHAHQKGIIHRDLKPSNVLVALYDGRPVPKVIDFGVAKATTQKLTEKTMFTQYGQVVGTLEYMSPEQAEVNQLDIDTRSDIYSLGVLLYELLTGTTPLDRQRLQSAAFAEMMRIIRDEEPPRPSMRLSTIDTLASAAANRRVEPQKLCSLVRGELDWIAMKALEKDRARRYETANGFAADIQRHLDDEPVLACPPSAGYRISKFAHRNRGQVAVAASLLALLCLGLAGTTVGMIWASREGARAIAARDAEAEARAQEAKRRLEAEQQKRRADEQRKRADDLTATMRRNLYSSQMNRAGQAAFEPGGIRNVIDLLDPWRPQAGEVDLRGWEWFYLHTLCHQELFKLDMRDDKLFGPGYMRAHMAWSPDGVSIAATVSDEVHIWNANTRQRARTLSGHADAVTTIAWSSGGRRLASASRDAAIRIWDVNSGQLLQNLSAPNEIVDSAAWSPNGTRLATASRESRALRIWRVETGEEDVRIKVENAFEEENSFPVCLAWSPRGEQIATGNWNGSIQLWALSSGELALSLKGHELPVQSICYSPDGEQLASTGNDGTVRIWELASGDEIHSLKGHRGFGYAVSWSPDGDWLASGGKDKTVRIWNINTGEEELMLSGHTEAAGSVSWSSDSRLLATSGSDRTIRVWDLWGEYRPRQPETLTGHTEMVWMAAWSPDGTQLASSSGEMGSVGDDPSVRLWKRASGGWQLTRTLLGHEQLVRSVCWHPDSKRVASASHDNTVKIWDAETGDEILTLPATRSHTVAWSPEGKRLAAAGAASIEIWDSTPTGNFALNVAWRPDGEAIWDSLQSIQPLVRNDQRLWVFSVAWSPDGEKLASGHSVGKIRFWDPDTGRQLFRTQGNSVVEGHKGAARCVAWSPDGTRLASAGDDGTVRIWDTETGSEVRELSGHGSQVLSVCWNPTGTRLASGSMDQTVKIWVADTGSQVVTLRGHSDWVLSVSWSPDGKRIVSSCKDRTIKVWDATVGYELERARPSP